MMITTTAYMSERFNRDNIRILDELGYEVHVVANFKIGNPTTKDVLQEFVSWVRKHNGKCIHIPITARPTNVGSLMKSYRECVSLIREHQYDFIHCHTAVASVIARMAAHRCKTKVIYTAHGFQFFKGGPVKDWLLYYPVEKFLSRWTDWLIVINKEDYLIAKNRFHAKHVVRIPGVGIDTKRYHENCSATDLKKEFALGKEDVILLSVGELNKNKNHEVVIKALSGLRPDRRVYYFIAGAGRLDKHLKKLSEKLGVSEYVKFLGYRKDVAELYACADVFVFPSKREGLSVALMEAMCAGLPVIASRIRGNVELVVGKKGGFLVSPKQVKELQKYIELLLNNKERRKEMGEFNRHYIKDYDMEIVNEKMKGIYRSFLLKDF